MLGALAVPLLLSCGGSGPSAPAASASAEPAAPRTFTDATAASGISFQIGYRIDPPRDHLMRFATSGVAAGDYDRDGDIDLFIVRGDIGPNLLYRNSGDGVFVDAAVTAGLAFTARPGENYRHTGPAFADMDGDGDLDLFIGGVFGDPSLIYANDGDGTFTDATAGSGIDSMKADQSISAVFGDYDLDGDLDMFIAHWGTIRDLTNPGDTEHLWRNESTAGTIRFTSVSEEAGISPSVLTLPDPEVVVRDHDYTFEAGFVRIDGDLYPDLVVVADHDQSMVFMNNGDGTFANATDVAVITDSFGMGLALADHDEDGDIDWFVTSIFESPGLPGPRTGRDGNRLYRNVGGVFVDATTAAGVVDGAYGWGACFIDVENDGDLDIFHTNGWSGDSVSDASRAFVANGLGRFSEQAGRLGLDGRQEGRGVVCADFDRDGDLDILEMHRGSPNAATLWRNGVSGSNSLSVRLVGRPPNTEAAGARIYATVGTRTQLREIVIGSNFLSQNPAEQVFGLSGAAQVDRLRIEWPDGRETTLLAVAAGRRLTLHQPP